MAELWSHELILKFLELYQNEAVLWDSTNAQHKDKTKTSEAWLRLSERLQRPVSELKKKKESLMATFRGHLRRKKESIRSGAAADEIYKPVWFAYELMEAFLAPVYDCATSINTQDAWFKIESSTNDSAEDDEKFDAITGNVPTVAATSASTITWPTVQNPPEFQETVNRMKEALNTLNNATTKRTHDNEEDECDLFGRILAKKLRKLAEHERMLFMYEIDGMFINRIRRDNSLLIPVTSSTITAHLEPSQASMSLETHLGTSSPEIKLEKCV